MTVRRYLDSIEVQMRNRAPSFVVEYHGHLDENVLARAFELLCSRHQVLRGRIRHDGKGYLLYVPPDHHPELIVLKGDESTLGNDVHGPWDITRGVAQLILIRGESRGFVALRADHSIVDGRSLGTMLGELWQLYANIANGSSISVDAGMSLPLSPYGLLKQRLSGLQSAPSPGIMDTPDLPDLCEALGRRIRLTEEDTARLIAAARAQKTSVHALVCGAILVTLRTLGSSIEPARMVCLSHVDLRNRVTPAVGATETTNFLGLHRAEVTVPVNGSAVTVGREIKEQLDSAIARGELPPIDPSKFVSSMVETSLEQYLALISVSNVGIIPKLARPAGLEITDFLVPMRPKKSVKFPSHGVYTFDKRLSVLFSYPSEFFTHEEMEQVVARITKELCNVSLEYSRRS